MTKKLETIKLVASLEKAARKTKKPIWENLAKRAMCKRRAKKQINLDKLNTLAKKFKGKTLIVPGKILAKGELTEKVTIVAISASESAKEKIAKSGKYIPLIELANNATKAKTNELVIVN
ncbi:MAG: 50S ribosomal protein L18e [Candidatus Diapherotrites archaeon]|jgi:large subunit ribosomal protein L18e|uniref:50S ribosomal protein L18e n=1 Tax=Candidatus Iainarchaeum sp. TaxID=3101447 RepID=A0A7K4BYB0_9ARCH|nr:50S ribosomal protein L18e [Candidatus Diapherotrites archaeon]